MLPLLTYVYVFFLCSVGLAADELSDLSDHIAAMLRPNRVAEPPHESDSNSDVSLDVPVPPKFRVRSPYRWLVPKDGASLPAELLDGASTIDSTPISLDNEGPDFWDVVAWLGTQVGRAVRLMVNAIIRLSKAIYVGIMYGWNEGRNPSVQTTLPDSDAPAI